MSGLPSFLVPVWSVLADLTSWFDWEALGAIGTVGALWFVVVQTSRTGRAERSKAEGILTFLIGLIEPVEIVGIYEEETNDQLKNAPSDAIDSDLAIVRRALRGLEALPLSDASAVGVVEWVMCLPLALKDIESALVTRSIDPYTPLFSSIRYAQEASLHFRKERDKLRGGFLINTRRFMLRDTRS